MKNGWATSRAEEANKLSDLALDSIPLLWNRKEIRNVDFESE
jgi:hypothetical protein